MYAVVKTGGKQYKVAKGDVLDIERLAGKEGDKLTLDKVLFVSDSKTPRIGRPLVEDASVGAVIEKQTRAKKIIVYKKKRRKGYEVRRGHRQNLTRVKITSINA